MFNTERGFFQDLYLVNGTFVDVLGCEGYAPLWTGLASAEQAQLIRNNLMNPDTFLTSVPFPTVAKNQPQFDPLGYWRGPVWLDQFYFAASGLKRYNFSSDAATAIQLMLNNTQGTQFGSQAPYTENYNPLNGTAQGVQQFGWSSACLILTLC